MTDTNGLPEVTVPANGQLAYELQRYIDPAQRLQSDSVTLTAVAPSTDSRQRHGHLDHRRRDPRLSGGPAGRSLRDRRVGDGASSAALDRSVSYATNDPHGREGRRLLGRTRSPRPDSMTPIPYRLKTDPIPERYIVIEENETGGNTRTLGPFGVGDTRLEDAMTRTMRRPGSSQRTRKARAWKTSCPFRRGRAQRARRHAAGQHPAYPLGVRREAVKVFSRGSGELAVPLRRLVEAGLSLARVLPLRVTNAGQSVQYAYESGPEGREIRFRVSPLVTDYTDENVYVVTYSPTVSTGMKVPLTISGDPPPAQAPLACRRRSATSPMRPPIGIPGSGTASYSDLGSWPYANSDPSLGTFDLPNLVAPSQTHCPGARARLRVHRALPHCDGTPQWPHDRRDDDPRTRERTDRGSSPRRLSARRWQSPHPGLLR